MRITDLTYCSCEHAHIAHTHVNTGETDFRGRCIICDCRLFSPRESTAEAPVPAKI